MEKKIKRLPSPFSYYITGVFVLIYAILFPFYRWLDYGICLLCAAAVYLLCRKILPAEEIEEAQISDLHSMDKVEQQVMQFVKLFEDQYAGLFEDKIRELDTELAVIEQMVIKPEGGHKDE